MPDTGGGPQAPRWQLLVGLAGALLGAEVFLLTLPIELDEDVSRRPTSFVVGEIAGAIGVSQTATASTDAVDRVVLRPAPAEGAGGHLVFRLYDVTLPGEPRLLFGTRHRVPGAITDEPLVIPFPRIERAAGRDYRFDLSMPDARPGQGLSFWMHEGGHYPLGELAVNGREQPADLVFSLASAPTSAWSRMARRLSARVAPVPGPLAMVLLLLLANVCLVAGLDRLLSRGDGRS